MEILIIILFSSNKFSIKTNSLLNPI